jgi:ribosomal protein L11 methyltransferase
MIPPDTMLSIYEIRGDMGTDLPEAPSSFVGLWNEEDFSYLFFTAPENEYVERLVSSRGLVLGSHNEMRYQDWQTGVPAQGILVGSVRFVGVDHPSPPEGSILLDPSVVFGDGAHPTTIRCLHLLDRIVHDRSISSVLDLGTGTGILALAAAAMGVKRILAVDRNHLAIKTTRQNVERNGFASIIQVQGGEARVFVDKPFDLVTANLPFHVLRDLVTMRGVPLHRFWIVSGINREQGEILKELLREQGHETMAEYEDPPWVTFGTMRRGAKQV